jgi:hypothetical protein
LREGPPIRKPRALELDYLVLRRRPLWPGLLVLVLSAALAFGMLARYREAGLELSRLQTTAGLVGGERAAARAVPKEQLDEEARNAEAVVRQLTLPWAMLIQAVERAATRDVALLQLQPDPASRLLKLSAEARHPQAMFAYVRRLAAADGLAEVHLVGHQVQRDDPQRPIQFSVQASLRGAR